MNFQANRRIVFLLIGVAVILVVTIIITALSLFQNGRAIQGIQGLFPTPTAIPYTGPAQIEKISPSDKATGVSQLDGVVITFKTPLPPSISVTLSPTTQGTYHRDEEAKTITFSPSNGFLTQTTYTATLSINNSPFFLPSNASVASYKWTFTTGIQVGEAGFDEETQQQFNTILKDAEDAYTDRKKRMPFIVHTPYETTNFTVSVTPVNDTVTITTHGNIPDEIAAYREEALDWIRENGGNPNTITFEYVNTPK